MKECKRTRSHALCNERGSSVYSILGIGILVAVAVAVVLLFPWGEILKGKEDAELKAARVAMNEKQWEKALTLFDKYIKSNPNNAWAYVGRSRSYLHLNNLDKAMEDAKTAIEKSPNSAAAYGQRGIVLKLKGQPEKAVQDFTVAVQLDPAFAWAYAQRADLYSRTTKDLDKALTDANQSLSLKPKFVEGLRLRAWIYNRMGKCREASEDFMTVEKLSPNDAWSMQDRAWFLLTCPDERLQDPVKAMELALKAHELTEGKDGMIQETLAEAYFRQGDALKAVEHQKKAVELGGKNCPDGSCIKEMQERLRKYELAARQETRTGYEILPMDSGL